MSYFIAQALGICGFIIAIISFQQNSQKKILYFQFVSSIMFGVQFFLLKAPVGALLNLIGMFRAFVFSHKDKAWARNRIWLFLFCALCIGAGIYGWENWFSILPIVGMIFTTVAFWIEDPKLVRRISFPSSPCWLVYNAVSGSVGGALTEVFIMCSILVASWRYEWSPAARARKAEAEASKAAKGSSGL